MPFVEIPSNQFIDDARDYISHHPFRTQPQLILNAETNLQVVAAQADIDFLGIGRTRFVYSEANHPERAIKVQRDYRSPLEARLDYYLQNIYSSVWPHNFPRVYASIGSPSLLSNRTSGNIDQRIKGEVSRRLAPDRFDIASFYRVFDKTQEVKYPFSDVDEECEEWRIPLIIDNIQTNFIVGEDGGEYYVDSIEYLNLNVKNRTNLRNILLLMKEKEFDAHLIQSVQSKIDRAYVLNEAIIQSALRK